MASSNIHMRDPAIYRIRHATHHRTGDAWCVYPMYDFAHCLSDAFEGITHSLCTLEFQEHRPLYEWFLQTLAQSSAGSALLDMSASLPRIGPPTGALVAVTGLPRQTEFSRLNVSNTVTSKVSVVYVPLRMYRSLRYIECANQPTSSSQWDSLLLNPNIFAHPTP